MSPVTIDSAIASLTAPVLVTDSVDYYLVAVYEPGSMQFQTDNDMNIGSYEFRLTVTAQRYVGEIES